MLGPNRPCSVRMGSLGNIGRNFAMFMQSPRVDQVILAPVTISGSPISRWLGAGQAVLLNAAMIETVGGHRSGYAPTQALWHQGD